MNNSELETLIRNILREQLVPATPRTQRNAIFQTVDEAVCAAHQAFLRFQQCPLKTRSAIISAIREDLTTTALTGDGGMVLFEYSPFGVIGSVTPSTNPTETIINNSISMLAAGNSVYFSPHPGAKNVSLKLITTIEDIAFRCSGIHNPVSYTHLTLPTKA